MPYAHEREKIPRTLDRRVKYTESDYKAVRHMFEFERLAQREIARRTGMSRRLVSFILFPARLAHAKALYKERRKDGRYYDKDKWRGMNREHRRYKQKLHNKGLLVKG